MSRERASRDLRGMERAMLDLMSALQRGIDETQSAAEDLGSAAREVDDRPAARVLLNLARRHRVEALKLQGQLAALEMEYAARFDSR